MDERASARSETCRNPTIILLQLLPLLGKILRLLLRELDLTTAADDRLRRCLKMIMFELNEVCSATPEAPEFDYL